MSVDQISPDLERIVSRDQKLELIGSGYAAEGRLPSEGPLWWKEGGYLLFADIGRNQIVKWTRQEGLSVFREPTDGANGLTRDPQGRLVACETVTRRVTRLEADGSITVVADCYQGTRLNAPNDVVVKSDGSVYFSDPPTGARVSNGHVFIEESFIAQLTARPKDSTEPIKRLADQELEPAVYRVSPDLSTVTLLATGFIFPNGLAFAPDESILYVDDSFGPNIKAYDVQPDGTLGNERIFLEPKGERPGSPDGMKVDVEGNIYCTGPGGVWVIDPSGRHLGTILTGADATTNLCFGGDDWKTMFITTWDSVFSIQLKIAGIPVPR